MGKNGNLCSICEKGTIKIINIKENRIIFKYDISSVSDFIFDFLDEEQIIILNTDEHSIKIISLKDNKEKEINLFFEIQEFVKTKQYLIFSSANLLYFYNKQIEFCGQIKCLINISNPTVIKDSEIIEILCLKSNKFSVINISEKCDEVEEFQEIEDNRQNKRVNQQNNNFKLLFNRITKEEKNVFNINQKDTNKNEEDKQNIESNDKITVIQKEEEEDEEDYIDIYKEDNLNENYFKDCISDMINITELLKYENDEDNISLKYKKNKSYLEINIVQENLKTQSKNLVDLKNFVEKEIQTKKIFKNKDEEYLFYINLLIKDETNRILLKKYLEFLKNIEENKITISYPHETFKDELNYYLPLFEKEELIKEFNYEDFKSEKIKVKELLINIKDSIEKKHLMILRIN